MSAPLAGRFVDHYEVLGVDSNADGNTIKAAYSRMAAKYSPANAATGDRDKFAELNASYEVLIDPELRKAFDGVRGGGSDDNVLKFPVHEFLADLDADAGRRVCLLTLLYYRRKYHSISPGISVRHVEALMKVNSEQLAFITWVLKQRGLVSSDDKSRLLVTVNGIEFVEKLKPTASQILPWLRAPEGEVVVPAEPEEAAEAAAVPATTAAAAPMPELAPPPVPAGPGLSVAGLSSLRTALQKSMGIAAQQANQKAPVKP